MCGIFCTTGEMLLNQAVSNLKQLEYRGYDSAGLAYITNEKLKVIKSAGEIETLRLALNENEKGKSVISHTRWATHGRVTKQNAHPHVSTCGKFALVHNGIIENYKELKEKFLQGVSFKGQTDSEVLVHLVKHFYNGNVLEALKKTCALCKGRYAVVLLSSYQPNKLFCAKQGSPLYIILTGKQMFTVSDVAPFKKQGDKAFVMEDGEYAVLSGQEDTQFYNNLGAAIKKEPLTVKHSAASSGKEEYPHYMLKEMNEVPTALLNTINKYAKEKALQEALHAINFTKIKTVQLIGCGTAYHACLLGKQILEENSKLIVHTETAGEFRYNKLRLNKKEAIAILVSQSGETADTLECARLLKEAGIPTVAITNCVNSSLTRICNAVLETVAGPELAVASTKAYNCQVLMFYLLEALITNKYEEVIKELKTAISGFKNFTCDDAVLELAKLYKNAKSVFVIGRKQDYKTALEAALKIKEITYMHCEGFAAGELKHGTLALVDNKTLTIAIITDSAIKEKTLNAVEEVLSRGSKAVIITNQANCVLPGCKTLVLPKVQERYLPLASILPLQRLAYYISVEKGYNPDKPKNLAKSVTVE